MPEERLAAVLHDARARVVDELDHFTARLERIADGESDGPDGEPMTLFELVALGMLAFVKAQRESSYSIEIAIREEMDEFVKLAATVSTAITRVEKGIQKIEGDLGEHRETLESQLLHAVVDQREEA